jgi:hypothetical protein
MVGESPSASVAVAEQVNVEVTLTPLVGLIVTLATTGSVLPTETLSVLTTIPPSESLAITVQVIVPEGDAVELERVILAPEPIELDALLQTYESVGVPPSTSDAVAEQASVDVVVTPLLGVIIAATEKVGTLLSTLTLAVSESLSPSASIAVAVQVMVSEGDAVVLVKVTL